MVKKYINQLQLDFSDSTYFQTILVEFLYKGDKYHNQSYVHASSINVINNVLKLYSAQAIIGVKDADHIFFHLYSNEEISCSRLYDIVNKLSENFETTVSQAKMNISVGIPVVGYKNVFKSYNMSVLASQKFFFHDDLKFTLYTDSSNLEYTLDEELVNQFQDALLHRDKATAVEIIKKLTSEIRMHDQTLIKNVKVFIIVFL